MKEFSDNPNGGTSKVEKVDLLDEFTHPKTGRGVFGSGTLVRLGWYVWVGVGKWIFTNLGIWDLGVDFSFGNFT